LTIENEYTRHTLQAKQFQGFAFLFYKYTVAPAPFTYPKPRTREVFNFHLPKKLRVVEERINGSEGDC
jgi:hypothetical protein